MFLGTREEKLPVIQHGMCLEENHKRSPTSESEKISAVRSTWRYKKYNGELDPNILNINIQ